MQRTFMEKRRRRPSYVIPSLFFLLEITMMWLLASLFNWDFNPLNWNIYAYPVIFLWMAFISIKLSIVLKRQKAPNA